MLDPAALLDASFFSILHRNNPAEGSQLGLVVSKMLVEQMGGEISIVHRSDDRTGFRCKIPMAAQKPKNSISASRDTLPRLVHGAPQFNILVAEDNDVHRQIISELLRNMGLEAQLVTNGLEALEAALSGEFNLVMLDIYMPGLNGLEVVRKIRASPEYGESLVLVAVSASTLPGSMREYTDAGFDFVLSKPIMMPDLIKVIQQCASVHAMRN